MVTCASGGHGGAPCLQSMNLRLLCVPMCEVSSVSCLCTHMCSLTGDWPCVWQPPICIYAGLHRSGQQMLWGGDSLSSHIQAIP